MACGVVCMWVGVWLRCDDESKGAWRGAKGGGTHPDAGLDRGELGLVDQVDLVEEDAVREGELLHGLVLHALRLVVVEVLHQVLGVHHRQDGVQAELGLELLVHEEGLRNGCWRERGGGSDQAWRGWA